ncbi:MAG: hypothetical protein WCA38_18200 [Candidatus Acidiferrales bacterium]
MFYLATGTATVTILTNRNTDDDEIPLAVLPRGDPPGLRLASFWTSGCSERPLTSPCLLFCS